MPSDAALLDAWRAGDRGAGNELVDRHFRSLYGFFCNKVGAAEVDELIQRTFTAAVASRDQFRGDSSFRTYLFAIARRELLALARRHNRDGAPIDPAELSLEAVMTSPSAVVARNERQQRLLGALRRLPIDLQIALELFYWEGLRGPELARVLDVPEGTIRTRIRRARQLLAEAMAEPTRPDAHPSDDDLERWATELRAVVQADIPRSK